MNQSNSLSGVWSGCAFPTQETTLIFCEEGKGLLFFYWGSCVESPFVDEFYWQTQGEKQILLKWISKHDYDDDKDDDTLIITSGQNEAVYYEITKKTYLKIEIGMHYAFDSMLQYTRESESFEVEKAQLRQFAIEFAPFGSNRQIWLVDHQSWEKLPPILPKEKKSPWWKFW